VGADRGRRRNGDLGLVHGPRILRGGDGK
jgi:hypothetical protein